MSAKTRINRPTTATSTKPVTGRFIFVSRGLSEDTKGKVIVSPHKGTTYRHGMSRG
jgi:hypothetical protein